MTREGKCDVCRKRKIKCDELWPSCGPCSKSSRPCQYSSGKVRAAPQIRFVEVLAPERKLQREGRSHGTRDSSRSSVLSLESQQSKSDTILALRKTTDADSGNGIFHKFTPIPASNAGWGLIRECQLSGQTTSLVLRWKSMCDTISPGEPEPYVIGEWLETIPQRIGSSSTVDAALDCFITSIAAYINRTEQNFATTCSLNAKALAGIRAILHTGDSSKIQEEALLAISFLYVAEVFRGVDSKSYKVHMRGRNDLMANMSKQGMKCSETCTQTFFSSADSDIVVVPADGKSQFMPSILAGKDSIIDTPVWLAMRAPKFANPEYPSAQLVEEYIIRAFVRIPRLIRLVRTARGAPNDGIARANASTLAAELYSTTLEEWVECVKKMGFVQTIETSAPACISLVQNSFHFTSARVFKRLLHYWHIRCAISSCVLALCRIRPIMPSSAAFYLDAAGVAEQERHAAECVAMSVQCATTAPSPLPLYEIRVVSPLISAFGVWNRLERQATTVAEAQRARNLQLWAADTMTAIGQKLNTRTMRMDQLRAINEILIGGPLGTETALGTR